MGNPARRLNTMRTIQRASMAIAWSCVAWGQGATPLRFEVASIRPSTPTTGGPLRVAIWGGPGSSDPGTIRTENMTLKNLIMRAYKVNSYQLIGPEWFANARFDIIAKVAPDSTNEQVLEMWCTLFSERFNLTLHHETREARLYALVVGKGGPKFKEASLDPSGAEPPLTSGGRSGGGGPSRVGPEMMLMSEFADFLARNVDRPVIDETALTARYWISLAWERDDLPSPPALDGANLPNIFSAVQEQLGLKLEAKTGKVAMLVIDHLDKTPVEN
jgi:uncharacterized protein (TIGR03435 family)